MVTELPQTFSYAAARASGVSKGRLYALRDRGEIQSIGRGVYRRTDADLADLDLLLVAQRAPMATVCLTSALAQHGLVDDIPFGYDIALPRGTWRPRLHAPVTWHSFAAATFEVGRGTITVDAETSIGLYDAPRSIVDAFRLRGTQGPELAYEALRRWLRRRGSHPAALLQTARAFPAALPALRGAMDALL